jgi:casein kinase 1, epsilon
MKLEPSANGYLHLENEYKSYQILGRQHTGIPHIKWFGIVEGYTAMALNLLGPSLEELFISNNHKFTPGTVSIIADQMVRLIDCN